MGSWRESGKFQSIGQRDRILCVIHAVLSYCRMRWRECAVQDLALLQKEQSGSCVLTNVICLVLCLNGASD